MSGPCVYCLHTGDWDRLRSRLEYLGPSVDYVAIGIDLHMEHPEESLRMVKEMGLRAYAHFLYYDIEEVVSQAAIGLVQLGFDALDLHAQCGSDTIGRTCEVVRQEAARQGRERPLVIACALLPSQLDLPWRSTEATREEAAEFAKQQAAETLGAGVDGILAPSEVAEAVSAVVPEGKFGMLYASRIAAEVRVPGWGIFYDWHLDDEAFWATDEGIELIRSRRCGHG